MSKRKVALHIDVNTTHANQEQRVVRIDAIELINGEEGKRFLQVLNPGKDAITPKARSYHHLTDAKVNKGSSFDEIAPDFLKFIKDATVVVHTPFTHHILNLEFDRLQEKHLKEQCQHVENASDMFKKIHPEVKGMCKLGDMANQYKIKEKIEAKKLVKVIQAIQQEKEAQAEAKIQKITETKMKADAIAKLKENVAMAHKEKAKKRHDEKASVAASTLLLFSKKPVVKKAAMKKPAAEPVVTKRMSRSMSRL